MLERVRTQLPLPERTAVITVDDGFADFAANAWPELQERRMKATLYVTAGFVGGRSSWLAPLQVATPYASVVEVQIVAVPIVKTTGTPATGPWAELSVGKSQT